MMRGLSGEGFRARDSYPNGQRHDRRSGFVTNVSEEYSPVLRSEGCALIQQQNELQKNQKILARPNQRNVLTRHHDFQKNFTVIRFRGAGDESPAGSKGSALVLAIQPSGSTKPISQKPHGFYPFKDFSRRA